MESDENLTGLAFGYVRSPEYEVLDRNETGVLVRVDVSYSMRVDCTGDGEPHVYTYIDGAMTTTTYFVTAENERLIGVSRGVTDSDTGC